MPRFSFWPGGQRAISPPRVRIPISTKREASLLMAIPYGPTVIGVAVACPGVRWTSFLQGGGMARGDDGWEKRFPSVMGFRPIRHSPTLARLGLLDGLGPVFLLLFTGRHDHAGDAGPGELHPDVPLVVDPQDDAVGVVERDDGPIDPPGGDD